MSAAELPIHVGDFVVAPVDRQRAMEMVVEHHYLHRKTTFQCALGLWRDTELMGVIVFGIPSSWTLRQGICGPDEAEHVIEITRLWVDDSVPKNGESLLIGEALRWLKTNRVPWDIVVSFADSSAGHIGRVYQATNFLYTGTNAHFRDPVPKGFSGHRLTAGKTSDLKAWYRETRGVEPEGLTTFDLMEARYGKGNVEWVERSVKHRYVIFNAFKPRVRELRRKLRYKVLPYPRAQCGSGVGNSTPVHQTGGSRETRESRTPDVSKSEQQMEGRE